VRGQCEILAVAAKLGVTALLEPEEDAAFIFADERLQLLEAQLTLPIASDQTSPELMGFDEVPNDLDQSLTRALH
jgi:hypothetical protein